MRAQRAEEKCSKQKTDAVSTWLGLIRLAPKFLRRGILKDTPHNSNNLRVTTTQSKRHSTLNCLNETQKVGTPLHGLESGERFLRALSFLFLWPCFNSCEIFHRKIFQSSFNNKSIRFIATTSSLDSLLDSSTSSLYD